MAANLTAVAISTRRVIRYGVLFVILMTIVRGLIGVGVNIYNSVAPKPTVAPTARFGPLPAIPFPKPNQELPALNITLETSTGRLPNLPTQGKVYYMPPYAPNLFSFDNAQKEALAFGYSNPPLQLSETLYRFTHPKAPSTLEMNIVTNSFSISYNLAANPAPLGQVPPTAEVAAQQVKALLGNAGSLPTDISNGPTTHEFLKVEGQNLVRAVSLSEANFVRVNLFRQNYDELPAVTADPNRGTIWFIMAGGADSGKSTGIIAAQYRYYPLDEKKAETYPLKSSAEALEDLKTGKGYIANLGINRDGNVTIRDIFLAYYDSDTEMQFYQPVFVFKGDRDFVAYVPAVTNQFYGK